MGDKASGVSKPLTAGQQIWLMHLKRCEAQGVSSVAYALEHGLSVRALYGARKELTQRGVFHTGGAAAPMASQAPVTLVPVQLRSPTPARVAVGMFRVVLPNGLVIEVAEAGEPARCQALVAALCGVST